MGVRLGGFWFGAAPRSSHSSAQGSSSSVGGRVLTLFQVLPLWAASRCRQAIYFGAAVGLFAVAAVAFPRCVSAVAGLTAAGLTATAKQGGGSLTAAGAAVAGLAAAAPLAGPKTTASRLPKQAGGGTTGTPAASVGIPDKPGVVATSKRGVAKKAPAGSSKTGVTAKPAAESSKSGTMGASARTTSRSQSRNADGDEDDTLRIRGRNFLHKKNGTQAEAHLVHHGLERMRDCLTARSWQLPPVADRRSEIDAPATAVTPDQVQAIWTELQQHLTRVDLETGAEAGAPAGADRAPEGAVGSPRPVGNLIECRFPKRALQDLPSLTKCYDPRYTMRTSG